MKVYLTQLQADYDAGVVNLNNGSITTDEFSHIQAALDLYVFTSMVLIPKNQVQDVAYLTEIETNMIASAKQGYNLSMLASANKSDETNMDSSTKRGYNLSMILRTNKSDEIIQAAREEQE